MSTESSSSSRSSSSHSAYDRRRASSSRYEDFRRASQILDEQADRQTWSEFLREAGEDVTTRGESPRARKRRLTGPSEDGRRGRGIGTSPNSGTAVSHHTAALPPTPPRPAFAAGQESPPSQPSFYDLTSPSSPSPQQSTRTSIGARLNDPPNGSAADYIVPTWQPDSDVTHCPICESQFTFWFRKHHCRKCGRVVCATCSPHRITIPRQYIVHPPENKRASMFRNETVDLTLEDADNSADEANMPLGQTCNPALGGGEEVRLCRPCVPDPQPAPSRSSLFVPDLRRVHHYTNGIPLDQNHNPIPGVPRHVGLAEVFDGRPWGRDWQSNRATIPARPPRRSSGSLMRPPGVSSFQAGPDEGQRQRDFRRQRGRGMIFQPEGSNLNAIRTGSEEIPEEGLPRYGAFNYTVVPRYSRPGLPPGYSATSHNLPAPPEYSSPSGTTSSTSNMLRNSLPNPGILPPPFGRPPPNFTPARPSPSGASQASPTGRPRVRSMFDPTTSSASSPTPRMQIRESDLCPICYRLFPPVGPGHSEAHREQHIADCISSREAAASMSYSHSRSISSSSRSSPVGMSGGHRQSISSPHPHPGTPVQPPPASAAPEVVLAPQMLPFKATEKDCLGQDGSAQECSICMVEYDVGDSLARLECLCCFHEACIRSWFERKRECPVHKIA